jgi:glycerophosphoryl diester phosphodiesterase
MRAAMAEGADGVELDVMRCATGEVVVVHDDDLGRVTGEKPGAGLYVRSASLADLQRFDVGAGERVPTLEQVLEELGRAALVNIELKSPEAKTLAEHAQLIHDDGLAAATMQVLRRAARPRGTTLLSSFDPFQLMRFAKQDAARDYPLGFLFYRQQALPMRMAWPAPLLPLRALHPDASLVDAVSMRRWRRRGYAVHVWTVDDLREVAALCALGVDAIITNRPGVVRKEIDRILASASRSSDMRADS